MKSLWVFVLLCSAAMAQSQAPSDSGNAATPVSPRSIGYFGLVYPLSVDWVGATGMMRRKVAATNSSHVPNVLLAAIDIPENSNALLHPFFTLFALDHSGADCKAYLGATTSGIQRKGNIERFSASGYDYYRVDYETPQAVRYHSVICTAVQGYLLVWVVGAAGGEGIQTVVSTLNSITQVPPDEESRAKAADIAPETPQKKVDPYAQRVTSGVTQGLKIKDVRPVYPVEARREGIQGTVLLRARISKEGDLRVEEVLEGPIELVGSAVNAARNWKYLPYRVEGKPVEVDTQVQVNYTLTAK
jgi:TonB family protein